MQKYIILRETHSEMSQIMRKIAIFANCILSTKEHIYHAFHVR